MSIPLCGQGTAKMKKKFLSCFINAPNHEKQNIFFQERNKKNKAVLFTKSHVGM
jgi:hypothetical protein